MSGNEKQIEYWNGPVGERWAKMQPDVDVNMACITEALLAFAAAKLGERVLDIGCGGGTTTALLSKAVGPSGDVTGVDISAPMLAVARGRGINANFIEADASSHSFKAAHDLAFSRFGIMFFAEPVAAFANIRKALKPHGRLVFVCWRAFVENAWSFAPYSAAKTLLPEEPPSDPFAPGPFAFADSGRLRNILDEAGFTDIRINPLDSVMRMGADVDEAAMQATRIGPLARAMTGMDDAQRENIRGVVKEALMKYRSKDGVSPAAACWLVGATV